MRYMVEGQRWGCWAIGQRWRGSQAQQVVAMRDATINVGFFVTGSLTATDV